MKIVEKMHREIRGRIPKYNFAEFADDQVRECDTQEEYQATPTAFKWALHGWAKANGCQARFCIVEGNIVHFRIRKVTR